MAVFRPCLRSVVDGGQEWRWMAVVPNGPCKSGASSSLHGRQNPGWRVGGLSAAASTLAAVIDPPKHRLCSYNEQFRRIIPSASRGARLHRAELVRPLCAERNVAR